MKGLYPKTGSGLYMFMYTDKGLFLLKGIDHSPRINSFTDLKNSGGIEEWTLTAEEHGHSKGSIGHSSFIEKEEYNKQRETQKKSEKTEIEESLQLKNENCKILYAGEILYLIPEYTRKNDMINSNEDVGFIVYWNNQLKLFELFSKNYNQGCPNNVSCLFPFFIHDYFIIVRILFR